MDLSAPIIYNSLTIAPPVASATGAPRSGIELNNVDHSPVAVDGYTDKSALADGLDAGDVFLGGRSLRISGSVLGSTKADMFDRMDDLLAAFSPTLAYKMVGTGSTSNEAVREAYGFLDFKFRQPTLDVSAWTAGYIPLQYFARPSAPPVFQVSRIRTQDSGRGVSIPFTVTLLAKDPRKYAQNELTSGTIAWNTTTTLTYRGNYPTMPRITVSVASATTGDLVITLYGGGTVRLDLTSVPAGDYFLVWEDRTFYADDGLSTPHAYAIDTARTTWGVGLYSTGSVQWAGTYSTHHPNTTFTVKYREAWA